MESLFPVLTADTSSMPQVLMQTALYGYILFVAANMIGDGAELLLLVPSMASLVGSIVLPILGAVPDGMMVLCSGLGEDAKEQVAVGVGALAGSTIMLLTLPWFLSVYAGRVSIDRGNGLPNYHPAKGEDKLLLADSSSFVHAGVTIGDSIRTNAKIMLATCTTYLVIQGPGFVVDKPGANHTLDASNKPLTEDREKQYEDEAAFENPFALAGLVMTTLWFFWYLWKMYKEGQSSNGPVDDKIVKATVEGIQEGKLTLRGAMAQFRETTWDSLCNKGGLEDGLLQRGSAAEDEVRRMCRVMVPFFRSYDKNRDNQISRDEFSMILQDLRESVSINVQKRIFEAADVDNSGFISFEEFIACMMAFALDPSDSLKQGGQSAGGPKRLPTETAYLTEGEGEEGEECEEEDMPPDLADLPAEEQQRRVKNRAFYNMALGTALVLLFSDPMTDMLGLIGKKTGVPGFYVSFLLAPLASNASELVSAMKLAQKRTASSMVQSLSTLEGAAIMNNTFCLAIFLVLIVWKGIAWRFSAETIAIVTIELLIGSMAILKKTHTLLDGVVIFSCYPLALVIVWVLENVFLLD